MEFCEHGELSSVYIPKNVLVVLVSLFFYEILNSITKLKNNKDDCVLFTEKLVRYRFTVLAFSLCGGSTILVS